MAMLKPEIFEVAGGFGGKGQWNEFEEFWIVDCKRPHRSLIPKARGAN
jgi:hypothetical protein